MSNQTDILLESIATKASWEYGLVTKKGIKDAGLSSFKKQIADSTFSDISYPIDAIYFSGENPFIHFKQLTSFNPKEICDLHRKIWNEGRTPILAVLTPIEIRLYDCFDIPEENPAKIDRLERGRFENTETDLKKLASILHQSKIDSGLIWEEDFGQKIKTHNRVDRKLVNNLAIARSKLFETYKIPFDVIHDLLGRSLFTLYLEDRGILTPDNYPSKPRGVNSFFDLLGNSEATYKLFNYLKAKFNGDLFPVTSKEEKLITKNSECLKIVQNCFSGNVDLITNQLAFNWRLFQFQYIPIELISSIYEEFMSEEDEAHEKLRNEGAFYTPQMLVEFVLNEVLPWPDENNKNYDLKILDPACGSGIFLVESYKRLIARWKYSNRNKEINEEVLEHILLNNIYGIEKDPEAIKVTAFSLYLTYLNYLEPRKVLTQVRFKPLVQWGNRKELEERENKKLGTNLYQFSTFTKDLQIFENSFDLVVGNPPWKLGNLAEDLKEYEKSSRSKLPSDIVCYYLDYMPKVAPNAKIALISTAKILFNTKVVYENFRKKFFASNKIDAIINLSVVRNVIFENAKAPATVFIYKKQIQQELKNDHDNLIIYCTPKSELTIKNRKTIVIDASEVKYLPLNEIQKENSKIFKTAMWGNVRDAKFIERLNLTPSIISQISDQDHGMGLIKDRAAVKQGNPHLENYFFLETSDIRPYYTSKKGLSKLGAHHAEYRTDNRSLFKAPFLLFKEGANENICTTVIDFNCVVQSSALVIKFQDKGVDFYKAMTACLNSTLSIYYFLMTSSSLGVDRERVQKNEVLDFPGFPFKMNQTTIKSLANKVDEIVAITGSNEIEFNLKDRVNKIHEEIDTIIYQALNVSTNEKFLINDALNNCVVLRNRYKNNKADNIASIEGDVVDYTKTLLRSVNRTLKNVGTSVSVEIINNSDRDPLRIIAFNFSEQSEDLANFHISSKINVTSLLKSINEYSYEQHSESIYYRKVIKFYKKNTMYFVKPNFKRFWSKSQALNDADNILLDLIED